MFDICRHGARIRAGFLSTPDNQLMINTAPLVHDMLQSIRLILRVLNASLETLKLDGEMAFIARVSMQAFLSPLVYNQDGSWREDLTT